MTSFPIRTARAGTMALLCCLAAAIHPAPAAQPAPSTDYDAFARGIAAQTLARAALKAYLGAAVGMDDFPVAPSPLTGRPAGPRDEPPPPEWPEGPVGLVVCLRVGADIRACEGGLEPPADQLLEAVTILGEKLATARARKRGGEDPKDLREGVLEASFILDPVPIDYAGAKRADRDGTLDLSHKGLAIEGSRGTAIVVPGEAASLSKAIRIARKAGAMRMFRKPAKLYSFTAAGAGSARLFIP